MKKTWWKVPLYCIVASWVGFQLRIQFLGKWARETLPNGSITINDTRWMLGTAVLFLAVVFIGGFFLFRKMTRKEIFCSASVLAAFNLAAGIWIVSTGKYAVWFFLYWAAVALIFCIVPAYQKYQASDPPPRRAAGHTAPRGCRR